MSLDPTVSSASSGLETIPPGPGGAAAAQPADRRFGFRQSSLFPPAEWRRLRLKHDDFARSLSTRLAILLRLDFSAQVAEVDTRLCAQVIDALPAPSHVVSFSVAGLTGAGLMELPARLGWSFIDRLCGGPGKPIELQRPWSEIEIALLDRMVRLFVREWCMAVPGLPDPQVRTLASETHARFLPVAPPGASMLLAALDARLGECAGKVHLVVPCDMLEPVLRQTRPPAGPGQETDTQPVGPVQWNPQLNTVRIPVSATWDGIEITARQLAALKAGDVLPVDPELPARTRVRLAQRPKFTGRLGQSGGAWAVELTEPVKA